METKDQIKEYTQEWDEATLSQYVNICNQSWPKDTYTVGNPETGYSVEKINHIIGEEHLLTGKETLKIERFVGSFRYDTAKILLDKFINEDPEIKIYHNFDWYRERLKVIKKNTLKEINEYVKNNPLSDNQKKEIMFYDSNAVIDDNGIKTDMQMHWLKHLIETVE